MAKKCDLSKEEEILALHKNIRTEFGGADVCINNAGLAHDSPLLSGTTAEWKEIMEVALQLHWIDWNPSKTDTINELILSLIQRLI